MNLNSAFSWLFATGLVLAASSAFSQTNSFPSSGNVGVGTTSPDQLLTVSGSDNPAIHVSSVGNGDGWISKFTNRLQINGSDLLSLGAGNATNSTLWITPSGNVGIWTSNPQQMFEISAPPTLNAWEILRRPDNTQVAWLEYATGPTADWGIGTFPSGSDFIIFNYGPNVDAVVVQKSTGYVGIGTSNPTQMLSVNGTILAKEVTVQSGWADYVFGKNYHLMSLPEVESSIKRVGHLPGVPSAREVAANGVDLGKTQALLLAKIEELTLHQIDEQKVEQAQDKRLNLLEKENDQLRTEVQGMSRNAATSSSSVSTDR